MKIRLLNIENLSYPELNDLDRDKTIFIMSASLLEQHGPHLPIGLDLFAAKFLAEQLQTKILKKFKDITIVNFPPLYLGAGGIPKLGTFNSKQRVVRTVIEDYCTVLGKYGFKYILISNGHGGPKHVVALEEAARKMSKKYNISVISLSGRIAYEFLSGKYFNEIETILGRKLTAADRKKFFQDSHAGWWETSMMLLINPDLVKDDYKNLPPFVIPQRKMIFRNKIANDPGYRGYPDMADKEFAEATLKVLIDKTMELISDMLNGKQLGNRINSPLYNLFIFRTNFKKYSIISLIVILVIMIVFFWK